MTIAQLFDSALSVFGVRTAEEPHYDIVERIASNQVTWVAGAVINMEQVASEMRRRSPDVSVRAGTGMSVEF